MVKHFIFAKLVEKFFTKVMQGDRRGLMKYFKIALVVLIVVIILILVALVFLIQFIFGLFTHVGNQADVTKNIHEEKIRESFEKVKTAIPEQVPDAVLQVKSKMAPYETIVNDAESVIQKAQETVERFEKLIP